MKSEIRLKHQQNWKTETKQKGKNKNSIENTMFRCGPTMRSFKIACFFWSFRMALDSFQQNKFIDRMWREQCGLTLRVHTDKKIGRWSCKTIPFLAHILAWTVTSTTCHGVLANFQNCTYLKVFCSFAKITMREDRLRHIPERDKCSLWFASLGVPQPAGVEQCLWAGLSNARIVNWGIAASKE